MWPVWLPYFLCLVIPAAILIIIYYTQITLGISQIVRHFLEPIVGEGNVKIINGDFLTSTKGIYFLALPNSMPSRLFSGINLIVTLVLLGFFIYKAKKNSLISFFFLMVMVVHFVSSMFFLIAPQFFPYDITVFSELYIEQQISIWLVLVLFAGLIFGTTGSPNIFTKIGYFLLLSVYSAVFGILRYFVFLVILYQASVIYMGVMFFILGPLFDFLYLVGIYVFYIYRSMRQLSDIKEINRWQWL